MYGDQIKEDMMGGECGKYNGEEKCVQDLVGDA